MALCVSGQETDRRAVLDEVVRAFQAGQHAAALTTSEAALAHADDTYSPWFGLYAAFACLESGRIDRGLGHVRDQLERTSDEYHSCWAQIVRCRLQLEVGRPDLARVSAEAALKHANALGSPAEEGPASQARGARHEARMVQLRVLLAESERETVLERIGLYLEDPELAQATNARADLWYDTGLVHEQRALDLEARPDSKPRDTQALLEEARIAFDRAASLYEEDLNQAGTELRSDELALTHVRRARIALQNGSFEEAARLADLAARAAGEQPRFGTSQAATETNGEQAARPSTGQRTLEALLTIEARVALALSAPEDLCSELLAAMEATLARGIERWRRTELAEAGVGFLHYRDASAFLCAYGLLAEHTLGSQEGARRALEPLVALQCLGTLARTTRENTFDIDAARSWLPLDGGLLLYLPSSEESLVFLLDRKQLALARLPGVHEIERTVVKLRRLLRVPLPDNEKERERLARREAHLSRSMADQLLPAAIRTPLAHWKSISVLGLENLGSVPLALACWKDGEGEDCRLGLQSALDWPGSLPLVATRARAEQPQRDGLLLIGGSIPSAAARARWPRAEALSLPEDEAQKLLAPYTSQAEHTTTLVRGFEASASRLRALGDYAVLQFLVHGVLDHERIRPQGLLLSAEDGLGAFFAKDVLSLSDVPPFVLLTSCGSGPERIRIGDPHAADLAGAWLRAGATAVLVTLGDVRYGDMLSLSALVHREFSRGDVGLAESLRRARRALAADDPLWMFRHGSVAVIGNGRSPLTSTRGGSASGR